jgi:hypothetical protein
VYAADKIEVRECQAIHDRRLHRNARSDASRVRAIFLDTPKMPILRGFSSIPKVNNAASDNTNASARAAFGTAQIQRLHHVCPHAKNFSTARLKSCCAHSDSIKTSESRAD